MGIQYSADINYRSIFNHFDVIGQQSYWIWWNKAK